MRPAALGLTVEILGFPRVSGDAPYADIVAMLLDVFSPRERGCALDCQRVRCVVVVFPA